MRLFPPRLSWVPRALAITAYVVIAAWWLWPLPVHLGDHAVIEPSRMSQVAADYHLIVWALAWDTHALLTRPWDLFDANVFFPAPRALAFSEHFLGYVPLFAPVYLVSGNPVVAANLTIFVTYPLCALAMAALVRRFASWPSAFVGGALFAFCGIRYANLHHFHQLGTFWMPLALLLTDRWLERPRARTAVALAAVIALQLLSSYYLAYAFAVLYAVFLPLALGRWSAVLDRRRLLGLGMALAVAVLPVLLVSLPYLEVQSLGLVPSARGDEVSGLISMLPRITRLQIRQYLTGDGVGVVGWALALVALLSGWRAGVYPRVLGLGAIAIGVLLAAGPRLLVFERELWSPYQVLARVVPGFAAIRLPFRFLVVAQLGVALLAALGLERIVARLPRHLATPVAAVAVALALVVFPSRPAHTLQRVVAGASAPPVYRWLAVHGDGGALLELPPGDPATTARRMVLGSEHWLPMLDGYSAYPPLSRDFLRDVADTLPGDEALQSLVDVVDVRWIVVHLAELEPASRRAWEVARIPGLRPVERFGDDLLFAVERVPVSDRRARVAATDATLGGVPLAPLGDDCRGVLQVALLDGARTVSPGAKLRLGIGVVNASQVSWPGLGFYPRYLVRVRTTFLRDGVPAVGSVAHPIGADVPRGEQVTMTIGLTVPSTEGSYHLEIALEQDGTSLERCGLAPVRLPVRVLPRRRAHSPM